jgi:thiol-disulfide isomerase/thioredoxin
MNRRLLGFAAAVAIAAAAAIWIGRSAPVAPTGVAPPADIVAAARAAGNARDFVAGADLVAANRAAHGPTPQNLEALSWLARTALAAGDLDRAERFARETHDLAAAQLGARTLDAEPRLPVALGAAIEVLGQAAERRGRRSEAVAFLEAEEVRYRETSIAKRIQKNINLISLVGKPAPALDQSEYLDDRVRIPASLGGRVVLMFFWAHWCSDCKAQAPLLASLLERYGERGLTVVAPTQRFGYVAGGEDAPPDRERAYIADVRARSYPMLDRAPVPLAAENHRRYGVSTTPTLVLVDRAGIVRLYHPGMMTVEQLEPLVRDLIG